MVLKNWKHPLYPMTVIICILASIASACGILSANAVYGKNGTNFVTSGIAVDMGNICLIVPVLLAGLVLMGKGSRKAFVIWFGAMLYVFYVYLFNCFTVHFNYLFLVYTALFGLSFFSIIIALLDVNFNDIRSWFLPEIKTKPAIIYLSFLGIFFIGFWLTDLVPSSIKGIIPKSAENLGLITAAFHALDVGLFFPGLLISAYLLLKKRPLGFFLAPAFLAYTIIMALSLVFQVVVAAARRLGLDFFALFLFGTVTLVSSGFLTHYYNYFKAKSRG